MAPTDPHGFNWDDLKYFLAVARAGTLRGAADLLGMNHTTVTRRLSVMEKRAGARLFDRSKQGLVITQLGDDFLPYAERVEEEMIAATRVIAGRDAEPKGTVHVTVPHGLALTSIVDDFTKFSNLYPAIQLNIRFSNDIADLAKREADVSFRVAYEVDDDVVGRKLVECSQAAYCTPEYAAQITDNGGEGLHFIGWFEPDGDVSASWIKATHYPKAQLKHRVSEMVPHVTLAAAGMGLAYLVCAVGDRHPDLVRAPFQTPVPTRSLWLLLHRDLRKNARVRTFVDFIAAEIQSRRDEFWVGGTSKV